MHHFTDHGAKSLSVSAIGLLRADPRRLYLLVAHTGTSPYPLAILTVVPLIAYQRYYGEDTVTIR
jgi:hypothetical protein